MCLPKHQIEEWDPLGPQVYVIMLGQAKLKIKEIIT